MPFIRHHTHLHELKQWMLRNFTASQLYSFKHIANPTGSFKTATGPLQLLHYQVKWSPLPLWTAGWNTCCQVVDEQLKVCIFHWSLNVIIIILARIIIIYQQHNSLFYFQATYPFQMISIKWGMTTTGGIIEGIATFYY